jgi:hypothetical protein
MGSVTTIVVAGAAGWLAVSAVVAATLGRIIHRADELATGRALRPALAVASYRGGVGVVVPITAARSAHQQRNRVIA